MCPLRIDNEYAVTCGNARKKYWRMSKVKWVAMAMPERYFIMKGLVGGLLSNGESYPVNCQFWIPAQEPNKVYYLYNQYAHNTN